MLVMDGKGEQRRKKNPTSRRRPPCHLYSLPDEILLICLANTSRSYYYRSLSLVSKRIRSLLYSPELYHCRSLIEKTEPCLYLCQELPSHNRLFFLHQTLTTTTTNGLINDELSLVAIPPPPPPPPSPSFPTNVAVGFEIYQMGGTINDEDDKKRPSSAVLVFDCRTHTWRDAPNMTVARKHAQSAFVDGKIFVVGGTDELSSTNWAEVFELKTQTWKPLPWPCPNSHSSSSSSSSFEVFIDRRGKLCVQNKNKRYECDLEQGTWEQFQQANFGGYKVVLPQQWCCIENLKFAIFWNKLMWYDAERRNWSVVKGVEDLNNKKHCICYATSWLANFGGKLVILCEKKRLLDFPVAGTKRQINRCVNKRIWCAVVRLEKRFGYFGLEIWGEIEQCHLVLTLPTSYKFLSCITL